MKQYLFFKLSAFAEYMTEDRIQNACMLALFAVILFSDWIVELICKFLGV
jgi:hypothetical protein